MSYRTLIDVAGLERLIDDKEVLIFDCRFDLANTDAGRAGYLAGHIPGAHYLDLETDMSAAPNGRNGRHPLPDRQHFAAHMAQIGLDRGRQVVSYDASGGFYASRLWWMLRWAGHHEVAVLDGGVAAWREAGLPLVTGAEQAIKSGDFVAATAPEMPYLDVAAVETNVGSGDFLLIDARNAERFRGEPHPLDPVSGHIPGATNRFFQHNLTPHGRFKPPAELARDFTALLDGVAAGDVVHQCGSGVTATHNLLAMEIAGLGGSRLYPGSWSEWVSDPARPIAIGPD